MKNDYKKQLDDLIKKEKESMGKKYEKRLKELQENVHNKVIESVVFSGIGWLIAGLVFQLKAWFLYAIVSALIKGSQELNKPGKIIHNEIMNKVLKDNPKLKEAYDKGLLQEDFTLKFLKIMAVITAVFFVILIIIAIVTSANK